MKNPQSFRNSGAYTSPGTPEYGDSNVGGTPKSWHSERVPVPTNSTRSHVSAAAMMPFNSGRALPSKWDDAERWITSPISSNAAFKTSFEQSQRRQKSKSGPQDLGYFSNYSPIVPGLESGNVKNYTANSPLTTGVLIPDGFHVHCNGGIFEKSNSIYAENSMTWGSRVPGLSDLFSETSIPCSQDYKLDSTDGEEALASRTVSRRDMATQMSPEGSSNSSSKGRLSFSALTSGISTFLVPDRSTPAAKDEIRDVQVDKGTTTSRHSKKQGMRKMKDSTIVDDLPLPWGIAEASRNASRLQREEAKITAWENLQKAKAEAAIQKLEMKLEKKRSKSMDKILNQLRAAQVKAQAMRNLPSEHRASRTQASLVKYFLTCSFCHHCVRNKS
ncbi:hypothetical protein F511_01924 [Dorcoceras hygrometricum]|uniref:Remorin C-terminal domain-containing protein n=1 Tax=Dorcoceras hygrometricum TaxID=472368 RepID=A0A2Z7ASW3_9LAMI|nr:hypothetical protein F511_01924 [Dorcoceras hygrometricum]